MIPNPLKILICLLFCNIIMTDKPTHTASNEIRVPELMFSSEHVPLLSITTLKMNGHYASLSAIFSLSHSATSEEQ